MNAKHVPLSAFQVMARAGQLPADARVLPSDDGLLLPLLLAIGCRA